MVVGLFTVAGNAFAEDKKSDAKKPTAEECKKAMDAKNETGGLWERREQGSKEVTQQLDAVSPQ